MKEYASYAETLENAGNPVVAPSILGAVRRILGAAALPATVDHLEAGSKFGRNRLQSALETLEARGEVQLSRRADAVFKFTPAPCGAPTKGL